MATEIAGDRTCVVSLGSVNGSPYGNHMVMVYGYYYDGSFQTFRAHMGWSGYSEQYIDSDWTFGAIFFSFF